VEVYGLTGGIGSGKSAVADLLEQYGVPVVSADELARVVVARGSEGLHEVVQAFGAEVLDEHGELDRRKMASIVFQDPAQRQRLEAILHPRIRERYEQVLDALEKAGNDVAVYEVPLLFEKNLQGDMKAVILVTADEATRIARVCARDDVTETEVRARMAAQLPEDVKRRRADYVLVNEGSYDELRREVEFMIARFLRVGPLRAASRGSAGADPPSSMRTVIPTGSPANAPGTPPPPAAGVPIELMPPGGTGRLFDYPPPRPASAPAPAAIPDEVVPADPGEEPQDR